MIKREKSEPRFLDLMETTEAQLRQERQFEQAKIAATAKEEAEKARKREPIRILNDQRWASREGTPPTEVFDDQEAAKCEEFINFMKERGFPESTLLKNEEIRRRSPLNFLSERVIGRSPVDSSSESFEIRGYAIAHGFQGELYQGPNIFLCEDAKLRQVALSRTAFVVHDLLLDESNGEPLSFKLTEPSLEDVLLSHIPVPKN